jgi:hypothetical protein
MKASRLDYKVSVEFLPGKENPADEPSRGFAVSPGGAAAFLNFMPASETAHEPIKPRFMT